MAETKEIASKEALLDLARQVDTEIDKEVFKAFGKLDNSKADKANGIFYIVGTGDTDGVWKGTLEGLAAYFDGLTIAYKTAVAGVSGGTTLNINSLGAVSVVRNATTAITTTYPVNSVVILTYTTDNGTPYWKVADYDSNTKTTTSTTNKVGTKLYLAGATAQGSGQTTYSNKYCYVGADNCLYSGGEKTAVVPTEVEFTLAAASWAAGSGITGFPYVYKLTVSGVTAASVADATIDVSCADVAAAAGVCTSNDTEAGTILFYARKAPTADLTGTARITI